MNRSIGIVVLLVVLVGLGAFSPTHAGTTQWTLAGTGDWGTPSNWTGGVPADGDVVYIRQPNCVVNYNVSDGETHTDNLLLAEAWNNTSTLNANGGTLLSGGTWASLAHGNFPGTYGTVNVAPGATFGTVGSSALMRAAYYGEATINVEGTFQTEGTFYLTHGGATTVNLIGAGQWLNSATLYFDYGGGEAVLNFEPGATGSFTNAGADYAYFLGLYSGDDLTYDGANSLPFDEVFQVTGSTLSLVPTSEDVPEPATLALAIVGLSGLGGYLRRHRRARRAHP